MDKKITKIFAWLALIGMIGGLIATIIAPLLW